MYDHMIVTSQEFEERLKWTLMQKIDHALGTIDQFYHYHNGKVYVAFSGGKDSTVLLWLVRKLFPDVVGVFSNTGLEFPEIQEFVRQQENIIWIKPDITFKKVIETTGYPVISKMQAQYIEQYRNGSEHMKELRWNGREYNGVVNYKISDEWKYLVHAPFKISDKCCSIMKKKPMLNYEHKSNNHPFLGIMATESIQRKKQYLQGGCNVFEGKKSSSRPLSFFYDTEIWEIIRNNHIPYSSIYDMGYNRTGCMFCMFGVHLEAPNRFQIMAKTHPKQYNYCMNQLGIKDVMKYIKQPITPLDGNQLNLDI